MMIDDLDFHALAETIPILCWIAGADGSIVWYNRRWYEYTGTTPAEMEGWGWQSVHDPIELPRVLAVWRGSIATGEPFEMVFPLRAKDGAFRPFLTRIVPTRDAAGIVTAWYGVNTDISEQRIAEAELRDRKLAEAQLLQANAAAEHARLQADSARAEAERASVAKSEFLASMSHEIRTPLNAIIGFTDLLLEEHRDIPTLAHRLSLIQQSGTALLTVVNDILDFSKIEAGQIEIDKAPFSPHTLVDNVASMLATFAEHKGIVLERSIDPALPPVLIGDEVRLKQVVLNLVNNAIKFTERGTVRIALKIDRVSYGAVGLRVSVSDDGIGISAEQQKTLFRRFSQVDGSITRRFGGTGLGLAICKQLIELMGGEIGVTSREGAGATFWFTVSLAMAAPDSLVPAVIATVANPPKTPGVSILLVEDVEVNQDLARAVLERMGHTVDIASDGEEAVAKVREGDYDLVLMDVQMPVMDGVTATKAIRASGHRNAQIPIVAMTANVLPQQVATLREAGMHDHVGKPFKAAGLQEVIARWARKSAPSSIQRAG